MPKEYVFEKAQFDYVNSKAKVVIVGITPGNSQLKQSREGLSLREIKRQNAFGGNMRPNLIQMLNHVGVNRFLGINSCKTLWEDDFNLVEMTSLLKEATYEVTMRKGERVMKMFNDVKQIDKVASLQNLFRKRFVADCALYSDAVLFVGLGPGVYDMLCKLKAEGIINAKVIGMAHPSGANAGRIACYLGKKDPRDSNFKSHLLVDIML